MAPAVHETRRQSAILPQTNYDQAALRALRGLRWFAVGAELAIALIVAVYAGVPLPLVPVSGLLALAVASNAVAHRAWSNPRRVIASLLALDVVLLTVLLALTGGPENPFSVVYLVYVMLAAVMASQSFVWALVALSCTCYGLLFAVHVPLPTGGGHHAMTSHGAESGFSAHLQGMWLAYTIAAVLIAGFVSGLATRLRETRERHAKAAHLLGLATLAAGAAHEIGNPLATIRVAASELEAELKDNGGSSEALSDAALINQEVGRAHRVLERMSASAGELAGESPVSASLVSVLEETVGQLGEDAGRIHLEVGENSTSVRWPVQATSQALIQLLRNAVQASAPDVPVACRAATAGGDVQIEVEDRGHGMEPSVMSRLGEPFFTTRPDEGMGLGVFIARSLIEHLGGHIHFESLRGEGTRVKIRIPRGVSL